MKIAGKLAALKQLYAAYHGFIRTHSFCCRKACAACCTRNVTLTTLEGYFLLEQLSKPEQDELFAALELSRDSKRFQPRMTINRFAAACRKGADPPEEEIDPAWTPCPILKQDTCPVYPVRPFGCRCLVSTIACGDTGYARMDPLILTVNNLFQQTIEHVDTKGMTGNLLDVLLYLKPRFRREAYARGEGAVESGLLSNHALSCLMIPPENRLAVRPVLDALQQIRFPD